MQRLGIDIGGSSVKVCLIDDEKEIHTARSGNYRDPSRSELVLKICEAVRLLPVIVNNNTKIVLCLPGKHADDGQSIEHSVNLPCLNGWAFELMLKDSLRCIPESFKAVSDVRAAGEDYIRSHASTGRTVIIAIGTGVGLCVFDGASPIGIGEGSIGHLGMMDVGKLDSTDRYAHDGARNTLESYVGARAIQGRFPGVASVDIPTRLQKLEFDDPILIALVRAIRIVHAIYVPDRIVLMGGVGIALQPKRDELDSTIRDGLTTLAKPNWMLAFGDSIYHAARGAAACSLG